MAEVTWYFDFISPYAYFGLHTLARLPSDARVRCVPVLFAGLLKHWGQKGPAEIAPKRLWTYRSCVWWAGQNHVPFRLPATHPFNSLPYLRLCVAAGSSMATIRAIFEALWTTGADAADPRVIDSLARTLGVPREHLGEPAVKDSLRASTDAALRAGVFGVPTLRIDDALFWGSDAVDFAAAYLKDPGILAAEEMSRAGTLPIGVSRPGSG